MNSGSRRIRSITFSRPSGVSVRARHVFLKAAGAVATTSRGNAAISLSTLALTRIV
ncbi:MAG: hypothetical protein HQQ74_11190 [Methanoculleus bourgensis]|uniref:Uncharacterized protein n=1 Tax=Methanoculleus bourgensis TaxID=83986 RepID=A0A8T7H5R3_9EURY|nr:hypothetical protein [Methanoculleus bourgensis]